MKIIFNIFAFFFSPTLFAQVTETPKPVPLFPKESNVGFLGNSITHHGIYHEYIHLFNLTRYPYSPYNHINYGIGGDRATDGINRWVSNVSSDELAMVTVMFGMNDIERGLYTNNYDNNNWSEKQSRIDLYAEQMDSLLYLIKKSRTMCILLTPSMYEQNAKINDKLNYGVNDGLGILADLVFDLGKKYDMPVVDFYHNMTSFANRVQSVDTSFSLINSDRVHPWYPGHFFMAYTFLKSQEHSPFVSKIVIDANKLTGDCQNCKLSKVSFEENIEFNVHSFSLPFPVDSKVKKIRSMIPFDEELNQEILIVDGLDPGNYDLYIDDQLIQSELTSFQLQNGINLEGLETPQHKQSQELLQLNRRLAKTVSDSLRAIKWIEYKNLRELQAPYDMKEVERLFKKHQEKIRGQSHFPWVKRKQEQYLVIKSMESEIINRADEIRKKLWRINQAVEHTYSLVKKR
ncbi:MAG: GDSL-type esterase/lipase family protein [Bacteroidota bacterium]